MIEASCHCGAVRIEIDEPPQTVTDCNCSLCRRLGVLWAYYGVEQVRVTGPTIAYVQGERTIAAHHCSTCGCTTHWAGLAGESARTAVNARLMDPAVLARARVRKLDGADTWKYLDEE